jgi:NADH-quinone oxidoreductase subunit G
MIEFEIDGRKVSVREGSTVMDGATQLGIFVPHFCYHRKLSIAANCRMCLVDIEKSPKAMPACATPAAAGMIVHTASPRARDAQKSVMEFLLINHPLDCPICDQGGECQLQDLAVGYGGVGTRYTEEKRVVLHKNLGPLVSAEEMARCIHCTRCVRFGQEIAGVMELGMAGHGEHSQIMPFLGRSVDSELSGNLVDVCPVGALTSKPFRYVARTWELARRRSVAPHDSLGSNIVVQVKHDEVVRVVPLENEAVNECWISDRDRFSYEGLRAGDRLLRPMVRGVSGWREVEWDEALGFVAQSLSSVRNESGAQAIAALASASATVEELHLLSHLVRAMGSGSIDHRARQCDFSLDAPRTGAPWLGLAVTALETLDRVLLVGAFPRADQPLLAARLRKAAARGARIDVLHAVDDDLALQVHCKAIAPPSQWTRILAEIAVALSRAKSTALPAGIDAAAHEPGAIAGRIAADLASGQRVALFAGNAALHHPQAGQVQAWMEWISGACAGSFGVLGEGANSVGAFAAGAIPATVDGVAGRNARTMFEPGVSAYLLWGIEPEHDCADPQAALAALRAARFVVSFATHRGMATEYAHAILPIAAFTETAGTFVNIEGRVQSFQGAVRAPGEARPGWKVLRVLGNELGLAGFQHDSPTQVRDEALEGFGAARLSNTGGLAPSLAPGGASEGDALERLPEVAAYGTDALVRRAASLQLTAIATVPAARANAATLARSGLTAGARARFTQGGASAVLEVALDAGLADGVVRIPAGRAVSAGLGAMAGAIRMEKA